MEKKKLETPFKFDLKSPLDLQKFDEKIIKQDITNTLESIVLENINFSNFTYKNPNY